MRRISQRPAGASQLSVPLLESFDGQVEDGGVTGEGLAGFAGLGFQQEAGIGRRHSQRPGRVFQVEVFQWGDGWCPVRARRGERDGDDRNIAVKSLLRLWLRQGLPDRGGPGDLGLRPHQLLGGFRRGNGWPAEVPAALDVQAEFKVEALGFVAGVQQQGDPWG